MKIEYRLTYWRCKLCDRIYTKANTRDGVVVCPECNSTQVKPLTIFNVNENENEKKEVKQ
jgi:hypothetical protein